MEGLITSDDLYAFLEEFGSFEDLPEHLKIFYDLRKASIEIRLDEINLLSQMAEDKSQKFKSVKTAFCVEDPKITAYAMLFSWISNNPKVKREQFSTKAAALAWLNSN